jgi:hypothetical protein
MKFEDVYGRYRRKELTTQEASELLNVRPRTFLRKRYRYEAEDFDGTFDRRLGKRSGRGTGDKEVERVTRLYEERYKGFSVKHFHKFAQREHSLRYGYT